MQSKISKYPLRLTWQQEKVGERLKNKCHCNGKKVKAYYYSNGQTVYHSDCEICDYPIDPQFLRLHGF